MEPQERFSHWMAGWVAVALIGLLFSSGCAFPHGGSGEVTTIMGGGKFEADAPPQPVIVQAPTLESHELDNLLIILAGNPERLCDIMKNKGAHIRYPREYNSRCGVKSPPSPVSDVSSQSVPPLAGEGGSQCPDCPSCEPCDTANLMSRNRSLAQENAERKNINQVWHDAICNTSLPSELANAKADFMRLFDLPGKQLGRELYDIRDTIVERCAQ